jgi:hypothetical protein
MSAIAHLPSESTLPTIGRRSTRRRRAAGLALPLVRLAASAAGLLPVLVPPLLGYVLVVGMVPG